MWLLTSEGLVWHCRVAVSREPISNIHGHVDGFSPELLARAHIMDHRLCHVKYGVIKPFCNAIVLWCIHWHQQVGDAMLSEQLLEVITNVFTTVIRT